MIKQIIVTRSKYWFERYCRERKLDRMETLWAYDSYSIQGHSKDTPVILVNGFTRLGWELQHIRNHFTSIATDLL